jgi:SNF2 family DNA or RNA helicase
MLKTLLLPHQQKTVDATMLKKYLGDFSSMGVGKSLSALASIILSKKKALIVCPPSLVNNWLHEISKHTTLKGTPHFLKYDASSDIVVIPYTQLAKAEDCFKNCSFIVSDEGHFLKNMSAKRTMMFHSLFYKYTPEYYMYLSGTPIKNRLPDIYSFLVLLSCGPTFPKITDHYKSFYSFACRFTNVSSGTYGMSYTGMKNVEELRTYLRPYTIKHSADVLDLPELTESSVVVSYSNNDELAEAFKNFTGSKFSAEITVKVQSAVAKAVFTSNYVREALEQEEGPIVVFSDHRKPLDIIELELSSFRVRQITGDTSMQKRSEFIDMFNNGQLDVLLCSFGAASTGINLTASNLMVFNDLTWEVSTLEQAKKRSHRMGQKRTCRIVHIIGSSVDQLILKSLEAKSKVIKEVIK